ncbi:MAG: ThuA domain-containing protein [Planctomycetota bacterium]
MISCPSLSLMLSPVLPAVLLVVLPAEAPDPVSEDDFLLVYEGREGPGEGKHVVLVAGDEEYRSEEALPMLARILAEHHGFRCTVLFSTDPQTGLIDPENQTHIPGLEVLAQADMLVLFLRFRELPDEDMRHVADYVESGKPILGIRTSTHAFQYKRDRESPFVKYGGNDEWRGGFGRQILGEQWVNHHGGHGRQSTRGVIEKSHADHPVLRGVDDVWGPTDVYATRELPEGTQVLLWGQVLQGMQPDSPALEGPKNDPMMPILWVREMALEEGQTRRVVCSTIGASVDLASAGLRRALVNSCYWGMRLEDDMPERSKVEIVGTYEPSMFGFGKFKEGVHPRDLLLNE